MRLRRRRRVVLVAAVVALGCALGMSAASGAPAPATAKISAAHAEKVARLKIVKRVAAQSDDLGIRAPAIPSDQDIVGETVYDAVQAGTSASVARSKTTLALPPSVVLTYIRTCGKSQVYDGTTSSFTYYCCPDALAQGCNPDFVVQTPATNKDGVPPDPATGIDVNWTRVNGPIWAASPPGSSRPYGIFPPTTVRLLAFGSVPATATVHISQPVTSSGSVEPLQYYDLTMGAGSPDGIKIAGFPGVKDPNSLLIANRYLRGTVDVRLDNVRVDGRPVDVGSHCQASGARLDYEAPRGEADPNGSPSAQTGRPGEFDPLNGADPGIGNASIIIPSFHGCRDERASLDPLVTNLASGKNSVQLKLRSGAYDCPNPDNPLQGCPKYPGYDAPINTQPTALIRALKKMPARSARNLVASLPREIRRELPASLR